jgi:hypothetical protein
MVAIDVFTSGGDGNIAGFLTGILTGGALVLCLLGCVAVLRGRALGRIEVRRPKPPPGTPAGAPAPSAAGRMSRRLSKAVIETDDDTKAKKAGAFCSCTPFGAARAPLPPVIAEHARAIDRRRSSWLSIDETSAKLAAASPGQQTDWLDVGRISQMRVRIEGNLERVRRSSAADASARRSSRSGDAKRERRKLAPVETSSALRPSVTPEHSTERRPEHRAEQAAEVEEDDPELNPDLVVAEIGGGAEMRADDRSCSGASPDNLDVWLAGPKPHNATRRHAASPSTPPELPRFGVSGEQSGACPAGAGTTRGSTSDGADGSDGGPSLQRLTSLAALLPAESPFKSDLMCTIERQASRRGSEMYPRMDG